MTRSPSRFVVGIDLGTSNCAMAFVEPDRGSASTVDDFPILQLQSLGQVGRQPLLPSSIYLPGEHDLPADALALPWDPSPEAIVGEFARWQGARVPDRLVTSAKSWLSHRDVDRTAAILPWGAPPEVRKMSPVEASSCLLRHMIGAWDSSNPDAPLRMQEVVITVPASFDEAARALTVNAARQAGLDKFTLVEEPQAAFYDFTGSHRRDLHALLEGIRLVLVVDVGGGTTDFTLIHVAMAPEGPILRRIAVGDHLMLGGDNMDAAVGRKAEESMLSGGRALTPIQWSHLLQASRMAKEALLGDREAHEYRVSIAGEGSRLIGSAISAVLSRSDVEQSILEGFFPVCAVDEMPVRGRRVALQEMGLPYAQDPAITRQLAAFLRAHRDTALAALGAGNTTVLPRPDAILLNGGVFNSAKIAARLIEAVSKWWPDSPNVRVLEHASLELAVARGAAYYGLVRRGAGRRIGGGTAHAFYVGLEQRQADSPMALCVIPRGHEEGVTADLGGRVFRLTLGRPVQFPLFTSTSDRIALSGEIVPVTDDLQPLPPIHALLKSAQGQTGRVPIHLRAALTEIGTLELWCVSDISDEQWRLEFELRGKGASASSETIIESMPPRFSEARSSVDQIFGAKLKPGAAAISIKQLWRSLESTIGPREQWRVPLLRELWSALFAGAGRRRRSADHERVFYQLLGYTLRPGFGYPLDDWRAEQSGGLFREGVHFHHEKPVWIEFWVMWRRIAGGLSPERHAEIWDYLKPHLARQLADTKSRAAKPKGIQPEGLDEMVRLAAALEHLPGAEKLEFGDWVAERLRSGAGSRGPWAWTLGRVGARMPLYGSAHNVVEREKAAEWLNVLFEAHQRYVEGALFAIAQIARLTGDRLRDLDEDLRIRALASLQEAGAPPSWQALIREVVSMETADKARALGDTLPNGLAA